MSLHRHCLLAITQEVNNRRDHRRTFVVMLDVNDFKLINDTYGHAEGDRALILIATALRKVTKESPIPSFLGRYGGDEFVLILHPINEPEIDAVIVGIRDAIDNKCREEKTPYLISVGAGYDEYRRIRIPASETVFLTGPHIGQISETGARSSSSGVFLGPRSCPARISGFRNGPL